MEPFHTALASAAVAAAREGVEAVEDTAAVLVVGIPADVDRMAPVLVDCIAVVVVVHIQGGALGTMQKQPKWPQEVKLPALQDDSCYRGLF
jgi:hypothetical protein